MPKEGQSGVVIPVPEADPLLTAVGERFPEAVRAGVPAHVSVLYPFLPAEALDDRVVDALSELFAQQPVMSVEFAECYRRGQFVALRPDPSRGLQELTNAVCARWPGLVPYDGAYGDVEPHLTVALRTAGSRAAAVEHELVPQRLPIRSELREAWLLVFDGRWRLHQRFAFGIG